ncbi:MAG TPA: hypothetical protein VH138_10950, partial [Vicinamibacterales bacterium]|nr:hypothetical protein [Vicinamibacterales bacterium]
MLPRASHAAAVIVTALALSAPIRGGADAPIIYSDDQTAASTIYDRDPGYRPTYLVYADTQRISDEARKLVEDLGLDRHVRDYKTRVYVVGPANGRAYDASTDLTSYQNFLRSHRSSNLKIVAVGAGATFVNDVIAKHAFSAAGILTYGGTVEADGMSNMPVPAYVHASNAAVAKQYVRANGATKKTDSSGWTEYTNPDAGKDLQRVVVSKRDDAHETLGQAFQSAWDSVFSRNYRLYMKLIESYAQGFDPNNYADPW